MFNRLSIIATGVALVCGMVGSAYAAVSAEEAKQLGTTLTPWGAEKAGNKEGTIPAYEGPVAIPASYDPKKPGIRPDPYANEKRLFSIDAKNMDKYADKLSEGVKAMLKKYPTFRVDVYPSHRNINYPKYILDNTLKNATQCKAAENGLVLEGCYGGVMFPIPKTGNEVMWNHLTQYESFHWGGTVIIWTVTPNGSAVLQGRHESFTETPIYNPARTTPLKSNEIFKQYRQDTVAPARAAGEKLLVVDSLDSLHVGERVWQYLPGQRRVKLAPDLGYDTPMPGSGGAATMDEARAGMGPQDRFDFKLLGKKELYIPYNNYAITDGKSCPDTKMHTPLHVNPDCIRWELHRVWHLVATVKPGVRHVYPKREFYFDEDAAGSGINDNYDASGKIYRVVFNPSYPMYETAGWMNEGFWVHDLATGNWLEVANLWGTNGFYIGEHKPSTYFTSEALAAEGIR